MVYLTVKALGEPESNTSVGGTGAVPPCCTPPLACCGGSQMLRDETLHARDHVLHL
jgi:hypothetical protein